jgi:MFS family permease
MSRYSAIKGKGLGFLLLLWSLWFAVMVVRTIIGPILPLVEDEFLINHAKATTLASLFALGAATSTLASGIFAGRLGYKRSVLLCLGGSVVMFLLIPHVRSFSQLAVLLCVSGAVWGTYFPCVIPIVTGHYAPTVWGRALAIQDTGASLSVIAAPLFAILMLRFISWRQFFYVFAGVYALCGTLFFVFAKEVQMQEKQTSCFGDMLKNRSVWMLAILWVFATGAFMGVYQVTPLYFTKELFFTTQYANTIFGLSRLGGVVFGVIMGFVVDRFNLKKSMFVVLFLTGLFTMLIGHTNVTIVQAGLFLQGTVIMGFFATGLMTISRMFKMEERSTAAGLLSTLGAVFGAGALPYLFGLAGDHLSFRFGMLLFGALVLLASGLVYFLRIPAQGENPSKP